MRYIDRQILMNQKEKKEQKGGSVCVYVYIFFPNFWQFFWILPFFFECYPVF